MSRVVLAIAVLGGLLAIAVLISGPTTNPPDPLDPSQWRVEDVAGSWSEYNEDADPAAPSWTLEELAAALGSVEPGRVVQMPGSITALDLAAVTDAITGTSIIVVTTPPTPPGASETTRVRDNTAQQQLAGEHDVQLIMVHGTSVYLPGNGDRGLYMLTTAGPGAAAVDAMLYADATEPVLRVIGRALGGPADPPQIVPTTAEQLRPVGRQPTAAELAPIVQRLQTHGMYVHPDVVNPPDADAAFPGLGDEALVVVLPTAQPGQYVDYTQQLHEAFAPRAVVVVTGSWIQTAGLDDQRALDVMLHLRAAAGIPLADSSPDPQRLLTSFSNLYELRTQAAMTHDGLPSAAPEGIPRWVAYLALATSLIIVAGFAVGARLEARARGREDWHAWRDRVRGQLLERYVTIGGALAASGQQVQREHDPTVEGPGSARDRLDEAYAALLQAQHAATRQHAARLVENAWAALDRAAEGLGHETLAPSRALEPADRQAPAWTPTASPATPRQPTPTEREAARPARGKAATARSRRRRPGFKALLVVLVGCGAIFAFVGGAAESDTGRSNDTQRSVTDALATASAATGPEYADLDIAGVQREIGTRSMLLVYSDEPSYDLARHVAGAYSDAIVVIISESEVASVEIGRAAARPGYDKLALIHDYYPIQTAAGADPVAQARQLAILYDRLVAGGSINGIDRAAYPDRVPSAAVAAALVAAVAVGAFLVYAATRRIGRSRAAGAEVAGRRDALQLRLAETATQLLHAAKVPQATLARLGAAEQQLSAEVSAAPADRLDDLRRRIERFDNEVNGYC